MKPSKTEQTRLAPCAPRLPSVVLAAAGAFAALLVAPSDAHAEGDRSVGIDVNRSDPNAVGNSSAGTGFDLAASWRSSSGRFTYASELMVGVHDFGGALHPEVYRLMFGSRFGIDWLLRPSVFTHAGVAELIIDDPLRVIEASTAPTTSQFDPALEDLIGAPRVSSTHLTGQLGVALDVNVLAGVEVGVQGSYNWVRFTDSFEWWQAGAHLTFVIGS